MKKYFRRMRGQKRIHPKKPLSEIFWASLGAFLGIFSVWELNAWLGIEANPNLFLIGSFGASAVLLYGAPMADFSQPRNLLGGHLLSALAGVLVHLFFPDMLALSGALAVSSAIAIMLITHTAHPPGGATALIATTGGPSIYALGFGYAAAPVLVGALIMLGVALLVNNLSANEERHYPKFWI
jgi:CBS domain-containing membrane protein